MTPTSSQLGHVAHVVAAPALLGAIDLAAPQRDAHGLARVLAAETRRHGLDDDEAAALRELDPRLVELAGEREGLIVDGDARIALDHPHRREHAPREALVVAVAAHRVVVERQEDLHGEEGRDEATAPRR